MKAVLVSFSVLAYASMLVSAGGPGGEVTIAQPQATVPTGDGLVVVTFEPQPQETGSSGDEGKGDSTPETTTDEPQGGNRGGEAIMETRAVNLNAFEADILRAHNNYRRKHGSPDLAWSARLQNMALQWARYLAQGHWEHSKNDAGENLYQGGPRATGSEAVKLWYDESALYKYNKPGFSKATGHFTQVVWKASTQLGCARAVGNNKAYIVCNYLKRGNMQGEFPQNVLPPRS